MKAVVDVAVPLFTFLLLTAVGLDLTTGDFRAVRREPRIVAIGLFTPVLVLPLSGSHDEYAEASPRVSRTILP